MTKETTVERYIVCLFEDDCETIREIIEFPTNESLRSSIPKLVREEKNGFYIPNSSSLAFLEHEFETKN